MVFAAKGERALAIRYYMFSVDSGVKGLFRFRLCRNRGLDIHLQKVYMCSNSVGVSSSMITCIVQPQAVDDRGVRKFSHKNPTFIFLRSVCV